MRRRSRTHRVDVSFQHTLFIGGGLLDGVDVDVPLPAWYPR